MVGGLFGSVRARKLSLSPTRAGGRCLPRQGSQVQSLSYSSLFRELFGWRHPKNGHKILQLECLTPKQLEGLAYFIVSEVKPKASGKKQEK